MASVATPNAVAMYQLFVANRHIPKNVKNIAAPMPADTAFRQAGNSRFSFIPAILTGMLVFVRVALDGCL